MIIHSLMTSIIHLQCVVFDLSYPNTFLLTLTFFFSLIQLQDITVMPRLISSGLLILGDVSEQLSKTIKATL